MSRSNRRPARRLKGFVRPANDEFSFRAKKERISVISQEEFEMLRDRSCTPQAFTKLWKMLRPELKEAILADRSRVRRAIRQAAAAALEKQKAAEREQRRIERDAARRQKQVATANQANDRQLQRKAAAVREARERLKEEQLLQQVNDIRHRRPVDDSALIPVRIDARTVVMMRPDRDPRKVISAFSRNNRL